MESHAVSRVKPPDLDKQPTSQRSRKPKHPFQETDMDERPEERSLEALEADAAAIRSDPSPLDEFQRRDLLRLDDEIRMRRADK